MDENYKEAYKEQATLVNQFFRYFITQGRWVLSALYSLLHELRDLAALADEDAFQKNEKSDFLEDAARICNKAFSNCIMDRTNKPTLSRRWGTYRTVGITLKCYVKANRVSLFKNILRSLTVQTELPAFEKFPKADQVTCKYYFGLYYFLQEEYGEAYREFSFAFANCHRDAARNQELILTYLIPLQLLRGRLPSKALLSQFPRLEQLYTPFVSAIQSGDVKRYDSVLVWAEQRLVSLNVWLCVEKAREICVRGLLKKVWRAVDQPTRLPISSVHKALHMSGIDVAVEEAECIIANMIYRGYVKGYISHEKQMVVLAAKDPFPSLALQGA